MKAYLFFLLPFLLMNCSTSAQDEKAKQLSRFVEKTLEALPIIPGVGIAVVGEDGMEFSQGFGYADQEAQIPATASTAYYIASVTKSFNGLLTTILAKEGKIDLHRQITEYLPFRNFKRQELFTGVTVMDLLSHQSGIDNPYLSLKLAYTGEYTEEQILSLIEEESQANPDGKTFAYTNYGYYLLDRLLQAELGQSWRDLLKEKVLDPLQMNGTTAYMSKVPKGNMAWPYLSITPGKIERSSLLKTDRTMHAAGGLVCTAEDAAKYLSFFIQKGQVNGSQVYPAEWITATYAQQASASHDIIKMFTGQGYGTGWRTGVFEGEEVVYHLGGYVGYYTHFSFLPKQKVGVAVMINHRMGLPLLEIFAQHAYDIYQGKAPSVEEEDKIIAGLVERWQGFREQQKAGKEELAKRTWELTLPKEKYTGSFYNEHMGTIKFSYQEGELVATNGNFRAVATPFPRENSLRLEFIPGRGKVLQFELEGEKITGAQYDGAWFTPVK